MEKNIASRKVYEKHLTRFFGIFKNQKLFHNRLFIKKKSHYYRKIMQKLNCLRKNIINCFNSKKNTELGEIKGKYFKYLKFKNIFFLEICS